MVQKFEFNKAKIPGLIEKAGGRFSRAEGHGQLYGCFRRQLLRQGGGVGR